MIPISSADISWRSEKAVDTINEEIEAIDAEIEGLELFLEEMHDLMLSANREMGSLRQHPGGPQIETERIEEAYRRHVMSDSISPVQYEKICLVKAVGIADNNIQADMYDEFSTWNGTGHDTEVAGAITAFNSSDASSYTIRQFQKFVKMSANRREVLRKELKKENASIKKYRKRLGGLKHRMENGGTDEEVAVELEQITEERQERLDFFDQAINSSNGYMESQNDYLFFEEDFTYPVLADALDLLSALDQ